MGMRLFPDQELALSRIQDTVKPGRNTLFVHPTGGGKTVLMSRFVRDWPGRVNVLVHRKELLGQISVALGREDISHQVVGPGSVASYCRARNLRELGGRTFVCHKARVLLSSVDTLLRRLDRFRSLLESQTLWVLDEAHHLQDDNKWGKIIQSMPRAAGLGVTANACRTDRSGLGRGHGGFFDDLILGSSMRDLITQGRLCRYRIIVPASRIDSREVRISEKTGDCIKSSLILETRKQLPSLVGDVIGAYRQFTSGKRILLFATDVQSAVDLASAFSAAGIPAQAMSADTDPLVRDSGLRRLATGDLKVVTSVALFDEGLDIPVLDGVFDAAPTMSIGRYDQRFGRMLRVSPGKTEGVYVDFAGNTLVHYPPDSTANPKRCWTLDGSSGPGRDKSPLIPQVVCPSIVCSMPYPRFLSACPRCGTPRPAPTGRTARWEDGDLLELTEEQLFELRGAVEIPDPDKTRERLLRAGATAAAANGARAKLVAKMRAQQDLRAAINAWGATARDSGFSAQEAYRLFFDKFGASVLEAQGLTGPEMLALADEVKNDSVPTH